MESSPPSRASSQLSPVAGAKRPAPSLLPPLEFEPRSKRQACGSGPSYPTPMPSSSVGFIPSSPPQLPSSRPTLQRTPPTFTERAPLSVVPTVTLPENGDTIVMGRSSTSCDYVLRGNSLISRVHVRSRYIPAPSETEPNKVEIKCVGYNGMKVYCRGRVWEIAKDERFVSDDEEYMEIMLDVLDSRVLVAWPIGERKQSSADSDAVWDEGSPRQGIDTLPGPGIAIGSSPLRGARLRSPVSPSPAGRAHFPTSSTFFHSELGESRDTIVIYEDEEVSDDGHDDQELPGPTGSVRRDSECTHDEDYCQPSSELSEPQSDFLDHNEENDPIIHAFGPSGENILPRMASLPTGASPGRHPLGPKDSSACVVAPGEADRPDNDSVTNHIVNQLAFSRTQSTPMSTLLANLPSEFKEHSGSSSWNEQNLMGILKSTACIGEISREGKDAAGKALENEFYYVPEMDTDQDRRAAVVEGLGKTSLRSCRKQHKQYFWRKPKN